MDNKGHRTIESQTMVVIDYYKKRTIESVQKGGTMEFPTRWLCCTGKRSCELKSCDHISTYQSRKKEKYGPSAQECNMTPFLESCYHATNRRLCKTPCCNQYKLTPTHDTRWATTWLCTYFQNWSEYEKQHNTERRIVHGGGHSHYVHAGY